MKVFIILGLFFFGLVFGQTEPPVVQTNNGQVAGYVKTLDDGSQSFIYEGIRYGKPPVGELRFQKPQPAAKWDGVYNATVFRTACMQPDQLVPDNNIPETSHKGEDCLFLSVYRPSIKSDKPRPVMMWVHGGGFETGSIFTIAYDASYIVTRGDVIVVTIQYRLGAFGFLYGDTPDTPGNLGLHDQILALKWIKQNIEAFGGDPNQVTIFGESAGGMSVGALVLTPLANGLFQKAILQSGAPNSYLGSNSKEQSLVKLNSLADSVKCTSTNKEEVIKCLRKVPAHDIIKACSNARTNGETFEPIWDDELLPVKPSIALNTGQFNRNLDLMFGTVSEEGALFAESIFPSQLDPDVPKKDVTITVDQSKFLISFLFQMFKVDYYQEVADFYTKGLTDDDKDGLRRAVGDAFGDYHLTCPTVFFGQKYGQLMKANKVYAYRVVQPPSIPVFLKCHGWMGVCHGDDVLYLFGFPIRLRGIVFTENDYKLSTDMIEAWTLFAKTGTPAIPNAAKWTEAVDHSVHDSTVKYMSLNASDYQMVDNYYVKSCDQFWKAKIFV